MLTLKRTNSRDKDFIQLVQKLDAYLAEVDGDEHAFYAQYNGIANLNHTIVAYLNGQALACGAIKAFGEDAMEVKRMYVDPQARGQGVASQVLKGLEVWAKELGYERCVLETGERQVEAVHLYQNRGYQRTPNYGQYIGVENSVCFEKVL
ncbi:MAG: GNAT family N-acetyltransferase [Bacteroidota bacterium]